MELFRKFSLWLFLAFLAPIFLNGCGGTEESASSATVTQVQGGSEKARALASVPTDAIAASTTLLLGSSSIQPWIDSNAPGLAEAFVYTAPASGSSDSVNIYIDASSTATRVIVGLYSDRSDGPGQLLGSATIDAPVAGAWNSAPLPALSIKAGGVYWIAVLAPVGQGELRFRDFYSGAGAAINSLQTNLSALPATWTNGARWTNSPASFFVIASSASRYSISGTISPAAAGAVLALAGAVSASTTVDESGNYQFSGLSNGTYTVTPSRSSTTFSPTSQQVTINDSNVASVNFTASSSASVYSISGTISPGSAGAGVVVALSGAASAATTTDASGNYNFSGLSTGTYTVKPNSASTSFSPTNRQVTISSGNVTNVNFNTTPITYSVSGTISPAAAAAGAVVALSGAASATSSVDASGNYGFSGLANGIYTVTPTSALASFSPTSRQVSINNGNVAGVNFAASSSGVPPRPILLVGSSSVEPSVDRNSGGTAEAFVYTAQASGVSSELRVFVDASSRATRLVVGVYADNGSRPTNLLTRGAIERPIAGAWNSVVLPAIAVSAGQRYWIALLSPARTGALAFRDRGSNGELSITSLQTRLTDLPTSWSSGTSYASSPASAYLVSWSDGIRYSISGTISPANAAAGASVALSGAASATSSVDASGNYSFSGLSSGVYTVTPSSSSASFTPAGQQVSIDSNSVAGVNFTASTAGNVIFFDDFAGTSLGSAWTVIQRRGPASQSENVCNTADAVGVSDGVLTITTSATPAVCGDAVTAPTQLPYTSGDIQWTNLNFTYGTVEVRAKLPPQSTGTWPAIWLLGANCQEANKVNGSEAVTFSGCPAQGTSAYQEIDMVECDPRGWCHIVVAQGSGGWSNMCSFPVDANWHVFTLAWNASTVSIAVDGKPTGCSYPNTSLRGPMFMIMQTQTTTSSGVGGLPNNANLPTTFQIDYVRVTQP